MSSLGSVLRILMEQDDVNAWLVRWSRQDEEGTRNGCVTSSMSSVTSGEYSDASDFDIDVRGGYGELTAQELRCIPFVPLQKDMEHAVVMDVDIHHLNEKTLMTLIPMFEESRFTFGVMYTNACFNPLPDGVIKLPCHRFAAFRTRFGISYIDVGLCSDGSVIFALMRVWQNHRVKLEMFHTPRLEANPIILSSAVLERTGLCKPTCPGQRAVCSCWRPEETRASDGELAGAYPWSSFMPNFIQYSSGALLGDLNNCHLGVFLGNGMKVFEAHVPAPAQSCMGKQYNDIHKLQFLFFDRLTTASSVRRSVPLGIGRGEEEDGQAAKKKRANDGRAVGFAELDYGGELGGEGEPSMRCARCQKGFRRRGDLRRHVKTVHEGLKSYECEVNQCGKKFAQIVHLQTHVRVIHEKRRDFACDLCHRTFAVKSNFTKHLRSLHGIERGVS
ncbi:Zinc finger protein [Porphyridium purpureum]|uniref:Zinc finger protein n=1 Tax=Porphyridium purpureum TaxID=35688 RepID=A0A5J4YXR6_PORPP|nr:Zinc finger protein [Porphyridium purpureum]|eukprot:POR9390..scf209_3